MTQFGSLNPYTMMNPGMAVGPHTGFEGMPGSNNFIGNLLYGRLAQHMQASGFQPMGLNQQNLLDQARNAQFMQMHQTMMQRAAMQDQENTIRTMQGLARAAGATFGSEQREATMAMLNRIMPHIGGLAADPNIANALELLGGPRGSQAVMAHRVIMGSRFRFDPATGRLGQGPEAIGATIEAMGDLVNRDDIAGLRGFTAGQVGSMQQFLLSRGLLSSGTGRGGDIAALNALNDGESAVGRWLDRRGIGAGTDIATLRQSTVDEMLSDREIGSLVRDAPEAQGARRRFDARRVAERTREFLGAARAIGDLFGRPDALIPELMATLEQFVGPTAMAQLSPTRVAQMVRETAEMSRMAGMTPQAVLGMRQHIANQAMAMGVEPIFNQGILRDTMAFSAAFTGVGFTPGFGRMSADQARQAFTNQRTAGVASAASNRLSAFLRLRAASGGQFADPEAERMAQDIQAGRLDRIPTVGELHRLVTQSGHDGATFNRLLGQTGANREFGMDEGLRASMDRLQVVEAQQAVGIFAGNEVTRALRLSDLDPRRRAGMGSRIIQALSEMDEQDRTDQTKRNQVIQQTIHAEMDRLGVDKNDPRRSRVIGAVAESVFGELTRGVRSSQILGIDNIEALLQMSDPQIREAMRRVQLESIAGSRVRGALEGLGRGSFAQRFIGAIQESPTAQLDDILFGTLGVPKDKVSKALRSSLSDLQGQAAELKDLEKQVLEENDPARRDTIREDIRVKRAVISSTINKVREIVDSEGGFKKLDEAAVKAREANEAEQQKLKEQTDKVSKGTQTGVRDTTADLDKAEKAKKETGSAAAAAIEWPDRLAVEGTIEIPNLGKGKMQGFLLGKNQVPA